MSDIAQRLTDRRNNVWEQMKAVAERAVEEKRNATAEEQGQIDAMNAELDDLDKRITAFVAGEKKAKEFEAAFTKPNGKQSAGNDSEGERSGLKEWAKEARFGDFLDMPFGRTDVRMAESEVRSLATSTGATGNQSVTSQLWQYAIQESAILGAGVEIVTTSDGNPIPYPRATAHVSASTVAENAAITPADPTLSTVTLSVSSKKSLSYVSHELLDDATYDLEGYLAQAAGRDLGNQIGGVAMTALIAASSAGVTGPTGTTTTFGNQATVGMGYDLLINLFYSVIAPYRNRSTCGWVLSDTGAALVRSIKTSTGEYVYKPATVAGAPDTIEGKPVTIDYNVASPAASAKSVLFGDLSSLKVRIAGGIRFQRSDDFKFDSDMAAFRAVVRTGAVSVDANAMKAFVHSAT